MRLRFQKGDVLAIGLVIVLAVSTLLFFLPGKHEAAVAVEIYHQGVRVKTLSLT